jgi:serine/threonine protein phosphatase PrpC
MPEIDFFQTSDVGCVREINEDAVGHWPHDDGMVFAIADGLGGAEAGEVASALALELLSQELARSPRSWSVAKRLRRAFHAANLEIYSKAIAVPELRGMGTTLTATALFGATVVTAHVGDTRLYLLRAGKLTQLTKDHTWVAEQVQYGLISMEQARTHPRRNVLTRCLGRELIVGVDLLTLDARPGDLLLHCSDGVHGLIEDREMIALLPEGPEAACRELIELARLRGAPDNASVQVAAVRDCPPAAARPRWWRLGR